MTNPLQAPAIVTPSGPAAANGHDRGNLHWHDLVALLDGLEHRLATQPVIEQSKGILTGYFGINPDAAFDVLRRWSSHTNLKVRDISRILVATAAANPPGDPRRAGQALTDLITCFDKGQIPRRRMNFDQTAVE